MPSARRRIRDGSADPANGRRSRLAASLALLLGLLAPLGALAQESVSLEVTVVHTSDAGDGVADDPRARKADAILGPQIRYESLSVVDAQRRQVKLNETWKVSLPNGRHFLVQPLDLGPNGLLVAVDLEGSAKVDARIKKRKPFVVGPQSHKGGKLSVILEADF